ncbi:hypothetical protein EQ826_15440 [Ectopseudomonas mendocina]|nr:hypothetical protein [Pseudomonas mendocina]TRO24853.1 hypothetical protein EQ826_15440 [Pseudomonas mendocina]
MTHIEILRFFNKWRRGDAESGALDAAGITPQMIGQAIDACIADAERYQWLRDGETAGVVTWDLPELWFLDSAGVDAAVDKVRLSGERS